MSETDKWVNASIVVLVLFGKATWLITISHPVQNAFNWRDATDNIEDGTAAGVQPFATGFIQLVISLHR